MNCYQIFLKNGYNILVQADYFCECPDAILFQIKNKDTEELVAYFRMEEIIGCTKIIKNDLDEVLNFWKENDNYGKRRNSQGKG